MKNANYRVRVSTRETFGLNPLGRGLKQCWLAIKGDKTLPPTKWNTGSLKLLRLNVSLPTWMGQVRDDDKVWVANLFNHKWEGPSSGHSVAVSNVEDHRGRDLSYDGHTGTDFAIPTGTRTCTPGAGHVCWVQKQLHRGGLKIAVDHGGGIFTSCNHMARSFVDVGDEVKRGDVIGLSGMSGVDGILFFPWLAPHVHFNAWAFGQLCDPYAFDDHASLWRDNSEPKPFVPGRDDDVDVPARTTFDDDAVERAIAACTSPDLASRLSSIADRYTRGVEVMMAMTYEGARFSEHPMIVHQPAERHGVLDLPFHHEDFSGCVLVDEV